MKKNYVTNSSEMRLSATKLMSTVVLLWFASTLWTTIMQKLGVSASEEFFSKLLNFIPVIIFLISNIAAYVAFSREGDAALVDGKKEDKFVSVMKKLIIVDTVLSIVVTVAYLVINTLLPAMISDPAYTEQQRILLIAAVQAKLGAVSNLMGKIFSVQLLYTVFAVFIIKKQGNHPRLRQFATAAAVISAINLLLLTISYAAQFALKKNTALSVIANYSVYAVYISMYLMFDARINVFRKEAAVSEKRQKGPNRHE